MKIAGVQCDVRFADPAENLRRMMAFVRQTAHEGARLTVFPECALTGYCYDSAAEALEYAQTIPGPATDEATRVCRELNVYVVFGTLEPTGHGGVYNVSVLVGPQGVVGTYRKIHLPFLGIDRFTTHGDRPFAVQEVESMRVGMNICFDASFPESARCLMLLGADLIVLPTNWPPGSQCVAQATIRSRALENGVYFMAVNRVGTERGFEFIGQSQLVDPKGQVVHYASSDREEIFYGDVDVTLARRKHVIRVPGLHEVDRLADRRPEMYTPLVQPHQLKSPGR